MYIVINNTKNKQYQFTGGWPSGIIEYMLDNGDDIIVISTYSNTIKVPIGFGIKFEGEWEWKEYNYSLFMFKE